MHLTVGYLATPTGDDGVALASAFAKSFDAEVDVVLVVREEMPDGLTLESALKKLNWDDADLLVVGSSRFAAPRRIFLGSTAARILAGTDAPVIVVPRAAAL